MYKVNEISNKLPQAVTKQSVAVGNTNNNSNRRMQLRSRHVKTRKNKIASPLSVAKYVKNSASGDKFPPLSHHAT